MNLRDELKLKYPKTIARAATGSRQSAIKLMCLECVGGVKADIKACSDGGCPLHPYRPWKIDSSVKSAEKKPVPENFKRGRQAT